MGKISMGIPGSDLLEVRVSTIFEAIFCGDIPLYMVDTSNQSVPEMVIDGKMMFPW
jgi:hypothetical protein